MFVSVATFAELTWLTKQLREKKKRKEKMTSVQLNTPPVSITGQQGDKAGEGGV